MNGSWQTSTIASCGLFHLSSLAASSFDEAVDSPLYDLLVAHEYISRDVDLLAADSAACAEKHAASASAASASSAGSAGAAAAATVGAAFGDPRASSSKKHSSAAAATAAATAGAVAFGGLCDGLRQ